MLEWQNFYLPFLNFNTRGRIPVEQRVRGLILDPLLERQNHNMWTLRRSLRKQYVHAGSEELEWCIEKPDEAGALFGPPKSYERIVFFDSLTAIDQIENLRWNDAGSGKFERASPLEKHFGWNSMLGLAALYKKGGRRD